MQHFIRQPKQPDNCMDEQGCYVLSRKLSFSHVARYNPDKPKQTLNASHECILPPTQGQVGHEIDRPTPKTPGRRRDGLQESSSLLGTVLCMLAHLTLTANLLAALPHVWPPHSCNQESIHPPCPEMSGYLAAVGFVQQHLLTHPRHHQPGSFSLAPKHQFKSMPCPHMEFSMSPTCSPYQLPHLCIRGLPGSFVDSCQKCRLDSQHA